MAQQRTPPDRATPVKSLETTFAIVEAVDRLDGPTVTEIATETGVAKSTVYDHLVTLRRQGFIVKSPDATYDLGLGFLDYGGRARRDRELYRIAKPELRKVARETGELVNLAVEENGMGVYLDYVEGENAVSLDTYVGKRERLHSTAFGQAILAHLPSERVDDIVDQYGLDARTDRTITDREPLENTLERVRERGYAVDEGERLERLRCVAAPILGEGGTVLGAISISGPSQRLADDQRFEELVETVLRSSNIIEINVTYAD